MRSFCTLFDSNYLTRGLALYHSLRKTGARFTLYVYCFDELCHRLLTEMELPGVVLVTLEQFESPELLAVKGGRSRGEYCWTCTSQIVQHALDCFKLQNVTYLDADLYFFADPAPLLEEFEAAGASVLITDHRYTRRYDQSQLSGKYCVQFVSFNADPRGLTVLKWWSERCLEWCYNRHEDGKFGDQMYLDDWTERFEGVHVLRHLGGGVAPWNVQQYAVGPGPALGQVPVVFYHFHDLAWYAGGSFHLGRYRISSRAVDLLYRPYIRALQEALGEVRRLREDFSLGQLAESAPRASLWKRMANKIKGKYRVIQG